MTKCTRWLAVPVIGLWIAVSGACRDGGVEPHVPAGIGVVDVLGEDAATQGFARAIEPPDLRFPRDHGPHPSFRTEWWYVTGNLDAANGRRFGVQLVFFRQALAPQAIERTATLAARDLMLAHAAVTDVDGGRFHHAERLARAAAGLGEAVGGVDAGGRTTPLRIVCCDWTATAAGEGDGFLPLDLQARDRTFSFALRVEPGKPIVLQGDRGLSQKSAAAGNASIYYSLTRLPMAGVIEVDGERHAVDGLGWIDREWSTSALGADQVGWDWFSLQLDDGCEVMWYRLRRADGGSDRWSRGVLVAVDGTCTTLSAADVRVASDGQWRAADGGAAYPSRWRLVAEPFELEVTPLLADQELRTLVRYWEGAVAVKGTRAGRPVTGRGYLEMTGYTLPR